MYRKENLDFSKLKKSHIILRQYFLTKKTLIHLFINKKNINRISELVTELNSINPLVQSIMIELLDDQILLKIQMDPTWLEKYKPLYQEHLATTDFSYELDSINKQKKTRKWFRQFFISLRDNTFQDCISLEVRDNQAIRHILSFEKELDKLTEYKVIDRVKINNTTYRLTIIRK